jgi:glycosyltransferase involved in cell wall biosynthesis
VRKRLGRIRRRVEAHAETARTRRRHARIERGTPATDRIAVYYGHDRIPAPDEPVHGGTVKFQHLERAFPNELDAFNVLYLGSSNRPPDSSELIRLAKERGAAVVWNQDGVAYRGWHGPGWSRVNEPLAEGVHAADYVFFQSEFCRVSSDLWLEGRSGPAEVLPNPVDTERFTPEKRPERPLTLLLGGNQYQRYRLEAALETLRLLPEARLLVAGAMSWDPDPRKVRRELRPLLEPAGDRVELLGTYNQAAAPALYRRADVLLHTKYNDPCPTVVHEAMACGVPVVYSRSGGTPELVGDEAGLGVEAPLDWERDHPPEPQELAEAVRRVSDRLPEYVAAARERSLRFDARRWVDRHSEVFERLVQG